MGDLLRILMIIIGVALLFGSTTSLARRRMTESYTIIWCVVGVVLVLTGIVIAPNQVLNYFSRTAVVAIIVIGVTVIIGAYAMSIQISGLIRQNREQSMDMAVMNVMIEKLMGETKDETKDPVRE